MGDKTGQVRSRFPTAVAVVAAFGFIATGLAAMAAPQAFFDAVATFDPYNQHFVQDIGAFNLGIGVTLLMAQRPGFDGLLAALAGAAVAAGAHVTSHVVGHQLGGTPLLDIPLFGGLTILLVTAAIIRHRDLATARPHSSPGTTPRAGQDTARRH
ncbi:MAG TPA: hypothetical protein VJ978_01650, partial [Nitriliruptoraceae bacterium]|nr:hypothetical protein [Nitriliruptoraceae bacterium]